MAPLPCTLAAPLLLVIGLTCAGHFSVTASVAVSSAASPPPLPLVVNVWPFLHATARAWQVLQGGGSPVDAVVEGCSVCEAEQCDLSVGFGGSPDESGETTLDALVMDGDTMDVGAVGGLRRVKHAARAALMVLRHSTHSLLVGDLATAFALEMGIPGPEDLSTPQSKQMWSTWQAHQCQPNFRVNVSPNSSSSCGPYTPLSFEQEILPRQKGVLREQEQARGDRRSLAVRGGGESRGRLTSHDTITMVAISKNGSIAGGSSTNGLTFHVPGRVGDAPIAGAGVYVERLVGGCGATGDGDIMMRFLPCFHAVELMRLGMSPSEAAQQAIRRIRRFYPSFQGGLFAVNWTGGHGGAVNNWVLQYTVQTATMSEAQVFEVHPVP